MPLLMSRNDNRSPDVGGSGFRTRSSAASFRSKRSPATSQKAAELRARYEMAQAIQKPWPLHLLENGVKLNATTTPTPTSTSSSGRRPTRTSTSAPKHSSSSPPLETSSSSSLITAETTDLAVTHPERAAWHLETDTSSSKKKRNSTSSLDKLSLSPTLTLSNWIRRASKDSDKSTTRTSTTSRNARSSSPSTSSSSTSPISTPKHI